MSWLKSALQVNNLPHMLFKSNWTSFFSIFVQFWWYSMLVELHFTEWTVHGWKSLRNRSFLQAGRTQKSVKPAATGHEENISKYCINITDARKTRVRPGFTWVYRGNLRMSGVYKTQWDDTLHNYMKQLDYELEISITWYLTSTQPESSIMHRNREQMI